jgi:hypothetical protein
MFKVELPITGLMMGRTNRIWSCLEGSEECWNPSGSLIMDSCKGHGSG